MAFLLELSKWLCTFLQTDLHRLNITPVKLLPLITSLCFFNICGRNLHAGYTFIKFNTMHKQYYLIFSLSFFLLFSTVAFGQFPGAGNRGGGQNMNMGHFYGKVVDSTTNKGIDAAIKEIRQVRPFIHPSSTLLKSIKENLR